MMGMVMRPKSVLLAIPRFHVFVLSSLWLANIIWLYVEYSRTGGDDALVPFVYGWIGWWLAILAPYRAGDALFIVLDCIGGVLAMALVGFVQDALRIPRWVAMLYPGLAILIVLQAEIFGPNFVNNILRELLISLGFSIYVVSFLSCVLATGWWIVRKSFVLRDGGRP